MKDFRLVLKNMTTIVVCFAVMTFAVSCGDDTETTYTLTVDVQPADAGTVDIAPAKEKYNAGEKVTLTATAAEGYEFVGWKSDAGIDDFESTENEYEVAMNANKTYTAEFQLAVVSQSFVIEEVANLPAGVRVAKVMVYDRDTGEYFEVASANLVAGKFTMILPSSLDDKYLVEAGTFFSEEFGYTVSNKGAKVMEGPDMVRFDGFNEAGAHIGEFFYRNSSYTVGGYLGFADADVLITGRFEFGDHVGSEVDFDFKTGWNWYYRNEEKDQTGAPAGVSLGWYFEGF